MRVAVTGAGGFTGRFVTEALDDRGIEWVPLSADLTDPAAVDAAVADATFDRIVHLAARAFVDASDWNAFYAVNQLGTFHLLDTVSRTRPGTRCILASSAQVYGAGAEGLVVEDAPTNPGNHYAISKLAMEQGARRWGDRLDICVARPFNYTGVGQEIDYLIPKIVDHFRRDAGRIELGNLFVRRDFGDVRAVAQAYAGLMTADTIPPMVNIGTGVVHSIDEIVALLEAISGRSLKIDVNQAFVRAGDVPVLGGDIGLLRATLPDWAPCDLEDTLRWMYDAP